MEANGLPATHRQPWPAPGELVVQNGRLAGARRPLGMPLTTVGRAIGCDIRLTVDAVDPWHCLLAYGPDGLAVRDLNSLSGTRVNGERVTTVPLNDGDLLEVGPFQFRVQLAPPPPVEEMDVLAPRDALRVQVAAVAAQQAALDEEEAQLLHRRAALQQQEEQLAAHLDERRRQLVEGEQRNETERRTLAQDRAAFEQESAATKAELEREQLRSRRVEQRPPEPVAEASRERLEFATERELLSRQLHDGRQSLDADRQRWRRRRSRERAVLQVRSIQLAEAERRLSATRRLLAEEKLAWEAQQRALANELHGLNNRVANQRQKLQEQQEALVCLESQTRTLQAPPAPPTAEPVAQPTLPPEWERRTEELERVAGELADQRAQLVEQWERLTRVQLDWQERREEAAAEMEAFAQRLAGQEATLAHRQEAVDEAEAGWGGRQARLDAMRQELMVWRVRLESQEQAGQAERDRIAAEAKHRQEAAQRQLAALATVRRKWASKRRQEAERVAAERAAVEREWQELSAARKAVLQRAAQLEEEKSRVTEEALAVEQYQREVLLRADDAGAEQRLERFRRRWHAQNAAAVLSARQEREALRLELETLEARRTDLAAQAERLTHDRASLDEQSVSLSHKEALLSARQARLDLELRQADNQRGQSELRVRLLQDEVDRLARALIPESAPPAREQAA